jgi:PKD repeat protein
MYDDGTNNAKIRYATYGRSMWETKFGNLREVNAAFDVAQSFYCSPGTPVQFRDQSLGNITSWSWSFPGGTPSTSTSQNPSVTYSTGGVYSATLTVSNGVNTSTITIPNYVLILSSAPKTNTGCTLTSNSNLNNGFGIGIFYFGLGTIANSTSGSNGYYNDYSCSQYTYLTPGNTYNATITTGTTNAEGAQVYIDWNDDGIFQSTEAVISFPSNNSGSRTLSFTVPTTGVVLNKGLRLRVVSRFNSVPTSACNTSTYGQAEDYTVYVQPITSAVLANGTGSSSICTGSSANLKVTITGGTSPYTIVISDGTNTQTINSYVSGTNISVSPTATTNYSIVSVMDNVYYSLTTSGTANVTVSPNTTWYLDADGDGYYINTQSNCVSPGTGWNTIGGTNGDCNDNDNTKNTSYNFYVDADADGFGTGSLVSVCAVSATIPPTGYSLSNLDCNDNNAAIHSPVLYYTDVDGDGFGSTNGNFLCSVNAPIGYAMNNTDCNDNNISMHQQFQFYVDGDSDGFGSTTTAMVCNANSTTAPTGYSVNSLDCNDANASLTTGNSFYIDADGDGFGSTTSAILCSSTPTTGYSSNNTDCDDNNASIHIGNTFYIDNDGDGFGSTTSALLCQVTAPSGYSSNNTDCNDNDALIHLATLIPTVTISATPSNIVTQGTSVTFNAAITNGGASPIYQWQKNNNNVGSNSNSYSTTPVHGDSIICLITSNASCISTANSTSNKIKMTVTPVSTGGGSNDFPCGSLSASSNIGSIAGYTTVLSAYDNGAGVYSGLDNSLVNNAPPSGPSLVYFTGNNSSATSVAEPVASCAPTNLGYTPKTVWYKFRVPTFSAGVTIRSNTSYGQLFNANLAVFNLTSGGICSTPVFNEVKCSSTGTLVLSAVDLQSYQGQFLYIQLQGTAANPSGPFTISIQRIIPNISLSNPTSSSIQVNFPSIATPNITTYLYWQRVGTAGVSYVILSPRTTYTISGLLSGYNYKVWIKLADKNTPYGSQIFGAAATLSTTTGCSSILPAPNISGIIGHCSQAMFNVTNPLGSIPGPLQTSPNLYPYRLYYYLPNTNRGWIFSLKTIPTTGFFISALMMNKTYGFYYTYRCTGGALTTSAITNYTTCNTSPRLTSEHHEYLINGVHYIDCEMEDLMAAATPENLKSDEWNEIVFEEIKSDVGSLLNGNESSQFLIQPNPADYAVNIIIEKLEEKATLSIFNVDGKLMLEKSIDANTEPSTIEIKTNELPNGTYIVNVKSNSINANQKLVITH